MRFVENGLISGSNYNGGGASDITALKASKSTLHSVRSSQKTPCVLHCAGSVNIKATNRVLVRQ